MAVALLQSLMFPGIRIDSLKCCPLCSSSLIAVEIGGRQRLACSLCQFVHWDNPKPVTATVVPLDGGLVLVKRKCEPCVGWWCLPGGFMEAGENPEQAARREVFEETGLTVEIDRLLDAQSPGYGLNVVILFYLAKPAAGNLVAGDDAIEGAINAESAAVVSRECAVGDVAGDSAINDEPAAGVSLECAVADVAGEGALNQEPAASVSRERAAGDISVEVARNVEASAAGRVSVECAVSDDAIEVPDNIKTAPVIGGGILANDASGERYPDCPLSR